MSEHTVSNGAKLLEDVRAAHAIGDKQQLRKLSELALGMDANEHRSLVDIAICLRDSGLYDICDRICNHIINQDSFYFFAHYELAVSKLLCGEHVSALLQIENILRHSSSDLRALLLASRLAIQIGAHQEANTFLRRAAMVDPSNIDLRWLPELSEFLKEYPYGRANYLASMQERKLIKSDQIAVRIQQALSSKSGFSLVRMGDGEGAFVFLSSLDENRFSSLYKRNRADRAKVWFNGEIDLEESGFTSLALGIKDVIRNADVVGVPYVSWIKHEYAIASPSGMVSLVNLLRVVSKPGIDVGQSFASQLCHMDLHSDGYLSQILRSQDRIGVISCHSQSVALLKTAFGFSDVDFHQIPGEKLHSAALGREATSGTHYPHRYQEIMASLSAPLEGRLYLVAGGILGKFYCDRIKKSGGVALDVGSLMDAWMGSITRPGMRPLNLG